MTSYETTQAFERMREAMESPPQARTRTLSQIISASKSRIILNSEDLAVANINDKFGRNKSFRDDITKDSIVVISPHSSALAATPKSPPKKVVLFDPEELRTLKYVLRHCEGSIVDSIKEKLFEK